MSKLRKPQPYFGVWRPDTGETHEMARIYSAFDAQNAARVHALYFNRHGGGHKDTVSWPITFHVRDYATQKTHEVVVDKQMFPEFVAVNSKEIR